DEFWGGFALNPPQSTLFCVLVARRGSSSPCAVLGGSCRQLSLVSLAEVKLTYLVSLSVARREVATGQCF
ncbi:hypothetical protein A2U01_0106492, partial [Trifolium medium]|nr:hypothetical protein [Trifolium medium]